MSRQRSLPLVQSHEELTGVTVPLLERSAKTCATGDPTHRALVFLCEALASSGLQRCAPPSAVEPMVSALKVARRWAEEDCKLVELRRARQVAFEAIAGVERATIVAVRASSTAMPPKQLTIIDGHADAVVLRFAGLGAYHACAAALLTVDCIETPARAARVPQEVAGALAYQATALGPARAGTVRATVCEQAEWESTRPGAPSGHQVGALAVQLLHELLGGYWRSQSDAQRLFLGEFAQWALAPAVS